MAILGDRINGDYLARLVENPDLTDEVESRITSAIFYAGEDIPIVMNSDQWDAVLVLMCEGKKALGIDS